jgi:hypothetical protein
MKLFMIISWLLSFAAPARAVDSAPVIEPCDEESFLLNNLGDNLPINAADLDISFYERFVSDTRFFWWYTSENFCRCTVSDDDTDYPDDEIKGPICLLLIGFMNWLFKIYP